MNERKIKHGRELCAEIYKYSSVGGGLHVLIDDGNLTDETIFYCIKAISEVMFADVIPEYARHWNPEYELKVATFLLTCSLQERAAISKGG